MPGSNPYLLSLLRWQVGSLPHTLTTVFITAWLPPPPPPPVMLCSLLDAWKAIILSRAL